MGGADEKHELEEATLQYEFKAQCCSLPYCTHSRLLPPPKLFCESEEDAEKAPLPAVPVVDLE